MVSVLLTLKFSAFWTNFRSGRLSRPRRSGACLQAGFRCATGSQHRQAADRLIEVRPALEVVIRVFRWSLWVLTLGIEILCSYLARMSFSRARWRHGKFGRETARLPPHDAKTSED
jgi:hypothetical protein